MTDKRGCCVLVVQLRERERQGCASPAHGQDQPISLARDGLGRPLYRHILLGMVRIAMAWVRLTQLFDGLDIGEKLLADHLNGLAVQRKRSALGFALQVVLARPTGPLCSRGAVTADTVHPDAGDFHLRGFQTRPGSLIQILERIHAYRLHDYSSSYVLLSQSSTNSCSSQVEHDQQRRARRLFLPLTPPEKRNGAFIPIP